MLLALFWTVVLASPRVADARNAEEQGGDVQTRAEILRKEREAKRGEEYFGDVGVYLRPVEETFEVVGIERESDPSDAVM